MFRHFLVTFLTPRFGEIMNQILNSALKIYIFFLSYDPVSFLVEKKRLL